MLFVNELSHNHDLCSSLFLSVFYIYYHQNYACISDSLPVGEDIRRKKWPVPVQVSTRTDGRIIPIKVSLVDDCLHVRRMARVGTAPRQEHLPPRHRLSSSSNSSAKHRPVIIAQRPALRSRRETPGRRSSLPSESHTVATAGAAACHIRPLILDNPAASHLTPGPAASRRSLGDSPQPSVSSGVV